MAKASLSVAEVVAASCCWLARFKLGRVVGGTPGGARATSQVEQYWHTGKCQFCKVAMEELMVRINATTSTSGYAEQERAFRHLSPSARAARVREAQERPWYDDLVDAVAAADGD